ncbi:MAG: sugar phosphate isomerase/epimerase family protein [Bryobacteraceae bacterium]
MISRRDFQKIALGALTSSALLAKPDSVVDGVQIGAQSYSFRDRSLDDAIKAMVDIGLSECELYQGHVEPKLKGPELQNWRETVSLDEFRNVRKKFDDAGIVLYAYNYSFRDNFTDKEIERGFEMAKALGVNKITASSTVTAAKRIDPFAEKYKIYVGMHNHSNMKDNEFNTPDSFAKAMEGKSKYIRINLDIGHFTAAGFNAVDYLEHHHDKILTIHIKDRKKDQGPNLPFGEGDTPIKQVLQVLKTKKYKIPANIEYEYKGGDTVEEVRKCYEYCKQALA